MKGVTLRQLRAFALLARTHSFARTAAALHVSPSAVSLQIKELERAVDVQLLERTGKQLTISRAGELLLVDVNRALAALDDAAHMLAQFRSPTNGVVTLGMVSSTKYFLPTLLARFHTVHPEIDVRLAVCNRAQLLRRLATLELDLVVMGTPPEEYASHAEPFASQSLGIVASPQHELAGRQQLPISALADQAFVVREPGSGTRAAMERLFREAQISPPSAIEVASNETIKHFVAANMGLAFLSLNTVTLELAAGVLTVLDVEGLPITRRWYLVHNPERPVGDAAETLRRFILQEPAEILGSEAARGEATRYLL
jgi:DNA-binding transcriptional LysR family regulator